MGEPGTDTTARPLPALIRRWVAGSSSKEQDGPARVKDAVDISKLPDPVPGAAMMSWGIVVACYAAFGGVSPGALFMLMAVVLLTLRAILAQPAAVFRAYGMRAPGPEHQELVESIHVLAERVGVPTPTLMLSTKRPLLDVREKKSGHGPFVFGSFRRQYIGIDASQAQALANPTGEQGPDAVVAVLLHELAHLKNGDHLWLRSVEWGLMNATLIALWSLALLFAMVSLLFGAMQWFSLLGPSGLLEMWAAAGIPAEAIAPWAMMMPSDAQWAEVVAEATPARLRRGALVIGMNLIPMLALFGALGVGLTVHLRRLREQHADALAINAGADPRYFGVGRGIFYPKANFRQKSAVDPGQIGGSLRGAALRIGALALVVQLLMSGTALMSVQARWPLHGTVLTCVLLLGREIVARSARAPLTRGDVLAACALALAPGAAIVTFTVAWLVYLRAAWPELLSQLLNEVALMPIAGRPDEWIPNEGIVGEAALVQLALFVVSAVTLAASALLIQRASERIFTWYSLEASEDAALSREAMRVVFVTAAALAVGVLPVTVGLVIDMERLMSPLPWVGLVLGAGLALAVWWRFHKNDARLAGLCVCGARVPGPHRMGRRCPECDRVLLPQLIAFTTTEGGAS